MFLYIMLLGSMAILNCCIILVSQWKLLKKAGQEGWRCLIPISSDILQCKLCNINPLELLLLITPPIFIYEIFRIAIKIAKSYEKRHGSVLD